MARNVRSVVKILYAGYPSLYLAVSAEFILDMCAAAKNCKITLKLSILEVEGHSKLSKLTPLKRLSLVLVTMNSM